METILIEIFSMDDFEFLMNLLSSNKEKVVYIDDEKIFTIRGNSPTYYIYYIQNNPENLNLAETYSINNDCNKKLYIGSIKNKLLSFLQYYKTLNKNDDLTDEMYDEYKNMKSLCNKKILEILNQNGAGRENK